MYRVFFTSEAYTQVDNYVLNYRKYFGELYQDTGVWEEDKIINNYIVESEERYFQILDTVYLTLEKSLPSYPNNQAIIRWRSKILLVSFRETDDTRIIIDIEIR